jgi:hypothetical protein
VNRIQQHLPRIKFRWFWSTRIATELPIGKPLQTEEAHAIASGRPDVAGGHTMPADQESDDGVQRIDRTTEATHQCVTFAGFLNLMFDTETQEGVS